MADRNQPDMDLDIDEAKLLGALCYVGVLVLVPLLAGKRDPFVVFHIKQGLVLLGLLIVSLMASAWIQVFGNAMFLVVILLELAGLSQALLGRRWKIPLIGQVADSFTL